MHPLQPDQNMSLTIIVGVSALFGISEAIKQTQSKARRDEHRSRKCHLLVHCSKSSQYSPILEGRRIVLSGDKVRNSTRISYTTILTVYLSFTLTREQTSRPPLVIRSRATSIHILKRNTRVSYHQSQMILLL